MKKKVLYNIVLIGPDGSGKTTIAQHLLKELPFPVKYIYMGFVIDSANKMLPTTRMINKLKKISENKINENSNSVLKNKVTKINTLKVIMLKIKEIFRLMNWQLEEFYRFGLAYIYQHRGFVVLFDRYFLFDYHVHNILQNRFHQFMLEYIYPKPELVIYLDAPPEIISERKGELSVEQIKKQREKYLDLQHYAKNFVILNTNQMEKSTTEEAINQILSYYPNKISKK